MLFYKVRGREPELKNEVAYFSVAILWKLFPLVNLQIAAVDPKEKFYAVI